LIYHLSTQLWPRHLVHENLKDKMKLEALSFLL
jgi:hypothetical protein